jgi:hypothetical protein
MVTTVEVAANAPPGLLSDPAGSLILVVTIAALGLAATALVRSIAALAAVVLTALRALFSALRALAIIVLALLLVLALAAGVGHSESPPTGPPLDISRAVG